MIKIDDWLFSRVFEPGDVVKLKSGGKWMAVNNCDTYVTPADEHPGVVCHWHDKYGRPQMEIYAPEQLEHVPPEAYPHQTHGA